MHPDLKHFYEKVIDLTVRPSTSADQAYTNSYKHMLDTHPNCEELLDSFAELAVELYSNSDGPAGQAIAEEMNKIERELDSNRVPF
jgi:hypothetical protein